MIGIFDTLVAVELAALWAIPAGTAAAAVWRTATERPELPRPRDLPAYWPRQEDKGPLIDADGIPRPPVLVSLDAAPWRELERHRVAHLVEALAGTPYGPQAVAA